jgi:hypothetical protein
MAARASVSVVEPSLAGLGIMDAADYVAQPKSFLLEGLLHPELTVLSGEAKVGKSALALHMIASLLQHKPLLDRATDGRNHLIYWAGTDVGWRTELTHRMRKLGIDHGMIVFQKEGSEPRDLDPDGWEALRQGLFASGVTVAVFDNLVGFAGDVDMDKPNGPARFLSELTRLADGGVAVVLVAHAAKGQYASSGRAAHSYSIEAKARHLIQMKGESHAGAKLTMKGNDLAEWTARVRITDEICEFRDSAAVGPTKLQQQRQRDDNAARAAERFLATAPPGARRSARAAGKHVFEGGQLGVTPSAESGRQLVNRLWLTPGFLVRDGEKGEIVAGPALVAWRAAAA